MNLKACQKQKKKSLFVIVELYNLFALFEISIILQILLKSNFMYEKIGFSRDKIINTKKNLA